MVFDYDKSALPDLSTGEPAPEECSQSGTFTLYRSVYKSTQSNSANCGSPGGYDVFAGDSPPISPPGFALNLYPWSSGLWCGTRDAYRWEREVMVEEDCVGTPYVED